MSAAAYNTTARLNNQEDHLQIFTAAAQRHEKLKSRNSQYPLTGRELNLACPARI
jgi:hypothetical protein